MVDLEIIFLAIFFVILIILWRSFKKAEEEFEFMRNIVKANPQLSEDELVEKIEQALHFRWSSKQRDCEKDN